MCRELHIEWLRIAHHGPHQDAEKYRAMSLELFKAVAVSTEDTFPVLSLDKMVGPNRL